MAGHIRCYVVVSGAPGSGKSTIALAIAERLCLPLLSKDTIKEMLLDAFEATDITASRRLGEESVRMLLARAHDNGCGVMDSTWRPSIAAAELRDLPGPIVEVFCDCPADIARERYAARSADRHAGHLDALHLDLDDLWSGEIAEPVDGGWPLVRVDTARAVDVDDVCSTIVRLATRS